MDADQEEADLAGYFDNVSPRAHDTVRVCGELGMCARELDSVDLSTRALPAYSALQGVLELWVCICMFLSCPRRLSVCVLI